MASTHKGLRSRRLRGSNRSMRSGRARRSKDDQDDDVRDCQQTPDGTGGDTRDGHSSTRLTVTGCFDLLQRDDAHDDRGNPRDAGEAADDPTNQRRDRETVGGHRGSARIEADGSTVWCHAHRVARLGHWGIAHRWANRRRTDRWPGTRAGLGRTRGRGHRWGWGAEPLGRRRRQTAHRAPVAPGSDFCAALLTLHAGPIHLLSARQGATRLPIRSGFGLSLARKYSMGRAGRAPCGARFALLNARLTRSTVAPRRVEELST